MFRLLIALSLAGSPATDARPASTVPSVRPASFALVGTSSVPTDTLTAHGRRRVERLLAQRVACLGCHTMNGEGGAIGPTLDGVGERLSRNRIRAILTNPQGTLAGSVMPAQPLAARDLELLIEFLANDDAWVGTESPTPPAAAPVADVDASDLYARHCASCHGVSGAGDGWNAANLPVTPTSHADSALMSQRADDTLYDAVHAGGWVLDKSARMPAFGALLSPNQIRSVVGYIRELCGCSGPSWSNPGQDAHGR